MSRRITRTPGVAPLPDGTTKLRNWSYSSLSDWETCGRKAFFKKIAKIEEEVGPPMERGRVVHTTCEGFLASSGKLIPTVLADVDEEWLRDFHARSPIVEKLIAWDRGWQILSTDGWVRGTWGMAKLDAYAIDGDGGAHVVDWKTGKIRWQQHQDQLELYALAMFLLDEDVIEVHAEMVYLDQGGERRGLVIERVELDDLCKKWGDRADAMLADTEFAPRENPLCGWCDFRSDRQGICPIR